MVPNAESVNFCWFAFSKCYLIMTVSISVSITFSAFCQNPLTKDQSWSEEVIGN